MLLRCHFQNKEVQFSRAYILCEQRNEIEQIGKRHVHPMCTVPPFFFPEPLQFKKITSNAHVKSQILVLVKKQLAFKVISLYPLLFALSRSRDGRIQTSRKHMRSKVLSCLDRPQSTVFSFSYKERQRNIHPTSSPGLFP